MSKFFKNWDVWRDNVNYNTTSISFTKHPPCYRYDCVHCPYFEYPYCCYQDGKKKTPDDLIQDAIDAMLNKMREVIQESKEKKMIK